MKQKQLVKKKEKEKVKFEAKKGSRITDNEAEIYGARIYQLMQKKGKTTINAKEVLQDAKNKTSPYHDHFTWDNKQAGEEHRLMQARQLISAIVIVKVRVEESEPIQVRAFVNVIDDEGEKGYVPIDIAISSPNTAGQIVQQALREAKSWKERYEEYQELSRIHKSIEEELQTFNLEEE